MTFTHKIQHLGLEAKGRLGKFCQHGQSFGGPAAIHKFIGFAEEGLTPAGPIAIFYNGPETFFQGVDFERFKKITVHFAFGGSGDDILGDFAANYEAC
jgi:hypothetical protein